jgi:hypothetical protein
MQTGLRLSLADFRLGVNSGSDLFESRSVVSLFKVTWLRVSIKCQVD